MAGHSPTPRPEQFSIRICPRYPIKADCFDTAFHHAQADVVTQCVLLRNLTHDGVRRCGFHGLFYEYVASVMPAVMGGAWHRAG